FIPYECSSWGAKYQKSISLPPLPLNSLVFAQFERHSNSKRFEQRYTELAFTSEPENVSANDGSRRMLHPNFCVHFAVSLTAQNDWSSGLDWELARLWPRL